MNINKKCVTKKLKVIHIVQHLRPGGIERLVLDLQESASQSNQVFIVSLEGDKETAIKKWPILDLFKNEIFFLSKPPRWSVQTCINLMTLFVKLNVDVVQSHHLGPLIYAGLAAILTGKPIIHTEHDAWHLNDGYQCKLEGFFLKLVKPLVVADANYVANVLKNKFPLIPIVVIHNGVNTDNFILGDKKEAFKKLIIKNVDNNLSEKNYFIGCAARLEPVKGHSTLLQAMKNLPRNVHLLIAGSGSEYSRLQQLANTLNISERVHFLGQIEDMVSFYQSLDMFCLPSLNEGFPLSPLEAQACGIPVVVSDVGGCKEVVCPDTGNLVTPNDVKLLENIIENRIDNIARISPSVKSRRFVCKGKTLKQMVFSYNRLIERSYYSAKYKL